MVGLGTTTMFAVKVKAKAELEAGIPLEQVHLASHGHARGRPVVPFQHSIDVFEI